MGHGRPFRHHLFMALPFVHCDRGWFRLAPYASAPAQAFAGLALAKDGGRYADLQRGALARLRRDASHSRGCRAHRPGRSVRLLPPVRHHRRQCLGRGGASLRGDARAAARSAHLLPPQAQELEPQGWQHRRLRRPLGRPLSADGRPRRRQSDDGRCDRSSGGGDGGGPRRRHHPEPAAHHQPQHDVRAGAAVRGAHRRPRHRRGPERLDGTRRQLLGS